jgi:hypothetical protein
LPYPILKKIIIRFNINGSSIFLTVTFDEKSKVGLYAYTTQGIKLEAGIAAIPNTKGNLNS